MRIQRVGLVGAMLLLVAACEDPVRSPAGLEEPSAALQVSRPFYYYQGEPIYLVVDPTRIVIGGDEVPVRDAVREATDELQIGADLASSARGHQLLALNAGTAQQADRIVARLRRDDRIEFSSRTYRSESGEHTFVPVNRVDVYFESDRSGNQVQTFMNTYGLSLIREPQPDSGFFTYAFAYPKGSDPLTVAQQLQGAAGVEWANPDRISDNRPSYVPQDPYYSQQFHLKNSSTRFGIAVDINVEPAWDLTTGANTIIAVIDDGVDSQHGSTTGDIVTPFAGAMGYDLLWDPARTENAFTPCCNDTHGTSVAGIIFAGHNNGRGGVGIAPNAVLRSIRIFRRSYPPESTTPPFNEVATEAEIAQGINWAWQYGNADVINNSWGGGLPDQGITTAINNALTMGRGGLGSVVVFAAGNTSNRLFGQIGAVTYPATLSTTTNVIAVAAINSVGLPANYTPNGLAIDVVAPSGHNTGACIGDVVTTDHFGSDGCDDGPGGDVNYTTTFSGTSAAAPQVSAVAALLLSREPNLTAGQVKQRIEAAADSWGAAITYGHGKLNALSTLSPPLPPLTASISGPDEVPEGMACQWQAFASGGTGNYSYQWSGVLWGWGSSISGVVGSSGTLYLTVTDGQGQASNQMGVSVDEWLEDCIE